MNTEPQQPIPQPQPPSTPGSHPVSLIPQREVLPRKYVLHLHSQVCKNCGTLHEWSLAYAFNNMSSRMGSGKLVVNLVPVESFDWNLPVEVVRAPRKVIPVCQECASTISLSHLPDPRRSVEWLQLYAVAPAPVRVAESAGASINKKPKKAKSPKRSLTIEDLL